LFDDTEVVTTTAPPDALVDVITLCTPCCCNVAPDPILTLGQTDVALPLLETTGREEEPEPETIDVVVGAPGVTIRASIVCFPA